MNDWLTYPSEDNNSWRVFGTGEVMYNSTQTFEAFDGDSSFKMWGLYDTDLFDPTGFLNGTHNNIFKQFQGIDEGTQFRANAMLYSHEDDYVGDGESFAVLFLKYFTGDWRWIGMHSSDLFDGDYGANDWHQFEVRGTVPPGTELSLIHI